MKRLFLSLSIAISLLSNLGVAAQPTVRLDATNTHQRVTGFGGFVCSPQFQYNHMSTSDIKKVWGSESTVGCNIMRLYLPIGRNTWNQSLQTAKNAKQMGLIVFASPWGQPAEWKDNGTSNAKNSDGTLGHLKKENWPDYAQYLEDYVQYLRDNGVDLDAISIQNEPDEQATYAGCLWSPADMAEFVKTYGPTISCRVMAPESVGASDHYASPLNNSEVLNGFDIYGGHQYGGIGSTYKQLAEKGKELWMTEYLINWNANQSNERNFDFSKDFFDFFRAINVCMLGDFNAWIHYAAKRYYGMLGDGQNGTSSGTVTKRGYVMAHFAKYVTGMTRIEANFGAAGLEGSAYISQTADTVVAVVANTGSENVEMKMDLPFYTQAGKIWSTTKGRSMYSTTLTLETETFLPVVTVPAMSVSTVLFVKSRDRQHSDMKGTMARFDRLDDMEVTKTNFGDTYKMSGKTMTFDHNNALISSRTNTFYGYVALDDRYSRLVLNVQKVSSTMNYSSAKTTLTYVNAAGKLSSHDYGDINLERRENFDLVFDLSSATLADGCKGLVSLTNNNWSSTLTLTLGDVTLDYGFIGPYAATLSGTYVADDSNVIEYTADPLCTSLDMAACNGCPSTFPWIDGTNRVVWIPDNSSVDWTNIVHGDVCFNLKLFADGGPFRPARSFRAQNASLTTTVDGCRLLMLPFAAEVPQGVKAYSMGDDLALTAIDAIPAHQPVLVANLKTSTINPQSFTMTFSGDGEVSFAKSPITNKLRGTYTPISVFAGDYVLAQQDGQWGLKRVTATTVLNPFDVYVSLSSQETFIPIEIPGTSVKGDVNGDGVVDVADIASIISVMAGTAVPEDFPSCTADVNGDGTVDVADIATVVSIMASSNS